MTPKRRGQQPGFIASGRRKNQEATRRARATEEKLAKREERRKAAEAEKPEDK